jgi:hypothetical protein
MSNGSSIATISARCALGWKFVYISAQRLVRAPLRRPIRRRPLTVRPGGAVERRRTSAVRGVAWLLIFIGVVARSRVGFFRRPIIVSSVRDAPTGCSWCCLCDYPPSGSRSMPPPGGRT